MTYSQKLLCLAFTLVVIGIVIVESLPADKLKEHDLGILDCKKVMGKIAKKTMKTFGNCTKEVKANSTKEDFDKKMGCILKCTLNTLGMLTPEGIVTKDTVQGFMDLHIPEEAHELGHVIVEDCLENHGSKLDKEAPFCETYGEFVTCMQNVIGDFADKANCNIGSMG